MPVFWGSLDVHHSRIPFAAVSRNRIRSPVNKNSELGVLIPLRRLVVLQRLPIGAVWPPRDLCRRLRLEAPRAVRHISRWLSAKAHQSSLGSLKPSEL